MQTMAGRKRGGAVAGTLTFLITICFISLSLAQEKSESSPCPKPYIKLIKPNLAGAGQQITIRGHRFGPKEQSGEVVFSPGLNGKITSWRNSRITVEVPSEAKTGEVVVKTKCATSNGEFFKVVE